MKYYFLLSYRIVYRKFRDHGINPLVAILALGLLFIIFSEILFDKIEDAHFIYLILAIYTLFNNRNNAKRDFLKGLFSHKQYLLISLIENLTISLPFILFLLVKNEFIISLILLGFSLISIYAKSNLDLSFTIPTPFSRRPFEFASYSRKSIILIILAYSLGIYSILVDNSRIGVFSILLLYLFALSYYTKTENIHLVWISSLSPKAFIFNKFLSSIIHSSILVLPVFLLQLFFYPENSYLNLGIAIFSITLLFTIIVMKYAEAPGDLSIPQGVIFIFCIWFPPLLLGIIPYYYTKSVKNLNTFLL